MANEALPSQKVAEALVRHSGARQLLKPEPGTDMLAK